MRLNKDSSLLLKEEERKKIYTKLLRQNFSEYIHLLKHNKKFLDGVYIYDCYPTGRSLTIVPVKYAYGIQINFRIKDHEKFKNNPLYKKIIKPQYPKDKKLYLNINSIAMICSIYIEEAGNNQPYDPAYLYFSDGNNLYDTISTTCAIGYANVKDKKILDYIYLENS